MSLKVFLFMKNCNINNPLLLELGWVLELQSRNDNK